MSAFDGQKPVIPRVSKESLQSLPSIQSYKTRSDMTDIYRSSLAAKYECVLRVIATDRSLGNDLTALTVYSLNIVHEAAEQAIMDWAIRRREAGPALRPVTNLQHLLDEYCAIADHL